jgi:hypothetical protein
VEVTSAKGAKAVEEVPVTPELTFERAVEHLGYKPDEYELQWESGDTPIGRVEKLDGQVRELKMVLRKKTVWLIDRWLMAVAELRLEGAGD